MTNDTTGTVLRATTVREARDILTGAARRLESEITTRLPGDKDGQNWARDQELDLEIRVDWSQLEALDAYNGTA
ncbi:MULTISPECIES: hypothetical protein [Streptomyces]|uniref:Uncharacterized protein n=1 Tax=Streptomyces muensis TaxID=1077944 RepID=A0A9X1PWB8_STRM4|nr:MULTISPECIES: hypothetical protein [Streptomyces]MCF1592506.1 hypothetical protein [Streptomyces muensis]QKV98299.1 hypothetical protein HUT19_42040 [Streptomyces sp. NA02950]